MTETTPADELALLGLSYTYAAGIDRRDRETFLSAFHPDAVLRAFEHGEYETPFMVRNGHEKIAVIVDRIIPAMCERTFHLVANARFSVEGDDATGEVYGVAHHLSPGEHHGGIDVVMYMRYRDEYRRIDGTWRISLRDALTDWSETRFVDLA